MAKTKSGKHGKPKGAPYDFEIRQTAERKAAR
jgi:hypothetical protein